MIPDWLIQIPLVAAFIWFALQLNKNHTATVNQIINDNRAASNAVMADWREYLRQRDASWQGFLTEQRNSMNESLDVLADRMAEISKIVAELDQHVRSGGRS